MNPLEINTLQELITAVEGIHKRWGREERVWFRGQPRSDQELKPRVYRGYEPEHEHEMVQLFRLRAPARHSHTPQPDDFADWLTLMQHYGLPTRLLDWTESLVTAAFFAVAYDFWMGGEIDCEHNGVVWMILPGKLNETEGMGNHFYLLPQNEIKPILDEAFTHIDQPEQSAQRILAVFATQVDARIQAQQGCFTIHGRRDALDHLPGAEGFLAQLIIPGKSKAAIATSLIEIGISLSNLFPDLAHLARDLATYYAPFPNGNMIISKETRLT